MSDCKAAIASTLDLALAIVEYNLSLLESGEGADPGLPEGWLGCARELAVTAWQEEDEERAKRASSLIFRALALVDAGSRE